MLVGEIASVVSASFGFNPRRLKQFLNVFRLQRFIAHYKQLSPENRDGATPEQLGKFVAILLRWPGILLDLPIFPDFLKDIGNYEPHAEAEVIGNETKKANQIDPQTERIKEWRNRAGFLDLLFAPSDPNAKPEKWTDIPKEWSLESFKTADFLNVRPGIIPTFGKKRHSPTPGEGGEPEKDANAIDAEKKHDRPA